MQNFGASPLKIFLICLLNAVRLLFLFGLPYPCTIECFQTEKMGEVGRWWNSPHQFSFTQFWTDYCLLSEYIISDNRQPMVPEDIISYILCSFVLFREGRLDWCHLSIMTRSDVMPHIIVDKARSLHHFIGHIQPSYTYIYLIDF